MKVRDPEYIIPVDLGQAADFTAVGGLRRVPLPTGKEQELYSGRSVEMQREYADTFHLGYAKRFSLHTPYPDVIDDLVRITNTVPGSWRVVMDATGVGRPVVDMAHEAGLNPVGIIITAGAGAAHQDKETGYWKVPKKELVTRTQSYMQSDRLKISAKLALCDVIVKEMLAFKMKITNAGNTTFEAWREGAHDDLVLMLCMGVWWGHMTRTGWQKDAGPHRGHDFREREKARERYGIDDEPDWT